MREEIMCQLTNVLMCRCTNWEILLDKCFPGSIGTRSLILFFRSKHRIPCRETYRLLFQDFLYFGSREFCFYDKTEHVFVEPFVCHDEMSLITTGGAPTVLYHPFHGFSVLIKIDCHQRHGMAPTAFQKHRKCYEPLAKVWMRCFLSMPNVVPIRDS